VPTFAAAATDTLLEATVIPGFTRPGYHARRVLYGWDDLSSCRMDGKVVLLTGATDGIGRAAAVRLAELGASVRSVSRSRSSADEATADIRAASGSDDVHVDVADLSRPKEVEAYADRFAANHDRLDVLVHNAGAFFGEHTTTPDGIEANAALYVLGPYVLTSALTDLIAAASEPRIVTVSTGGAYASGLNVDRIEASPDGYRPLLAYAHTKRAQIALTHLWAARYPEANVHAMQPGWCRTDLVDHGLPTFRRVLGPVLRDADMGADTLVYLAAADAPARSTGRLWRDRLPRSEHRLPWTRVPIDEEAALWAWCAEASGHEARR
jgi:dehydrogenase/reductase SDR family member 12